MKTILGEQIWLSSARRKSKEIIKDKLKLREWGDRNNMIKKKDEKKWKIWKRWTKLWSRIKNNKTLISWLGNNILRIYKLEKGPKRELGESSRDIMTSQSNNSPRQSPAITTTIRKIGHKLNNNPGTALLKKREILPIYITSNREQNRLSQHSNN